MPAIVGHLLIVVVAALQPAAATLQPAAATWIGKAEAPIDGDTLRVRDEQDKLHKIRIQVISPVPFNLQSWNLDVIVFKVFSKIASSNPV